MIRKYIIIFAFSSFAFASESELSVATKELCKKIGKNHAQDTVLCNKIIKNDGPLDINVIPVCSEIANHSVIYGMTCVEKAAGKKFPKNATQNCINIAKKVKENSVNAIACVEVSVNKEFDNNILKTCDVLANYSTFNGYHCLSYAANSNFSAPAAEFCTAMAKETKDFATYTFNCLELTADKNLSEDDLAPCFEELLNGGEFAPFKAKECLLQF
ncbi:hypothetical protein [Halobacteriovorax sp. RT-1-4]|uniref:hypothetical protein n=1 Tax=unclassified Halobacteriovorax TaxID=2639665 RepID=UPI00399BB540